MFFSTKKDESTVSIKKKKLANIDSKLDYESRLKAKYEASLLSSEEMQQNLYPVPDLPIYSEYLDLSKVVPSEKLSIKDMILGLDCEMVYQIYI